MKAHNVRHAVKGFALIATISVLLLLTMVAVAFLSLSALTVKTSRFEWAQEEARANARLGLMIAIGELQRDLGPDQRIAVSASLLDSNPDTLAIEGVNNEQWTGVVSSRFDQNQNGSPFTRDMDDGGLQDARNGTNFRVRDQVTNYLVSGNEGGRDKMRGARQYQDALTENLPLGQDVVEIVSRGSVRNPRDFVRVRKVVTEKPRLTPDGRTEIRPNGGYAWWVQSNNQKAHVGRSMPDAVRRFASENSFSGVNMMNKKHFNSKIGNMFAIANSYPFQSLLSNWIGAGGEDEHKTRMDQVLALENQYKLSQIPSTLGKNIESHYSEEPTVKIWNLIKGLRVERAEAELKSWKNFGKVELDLEFLKKVYDPRRKNIKVLHLLQDVGGLSAAEVDYIAKVKP